VSAVGCGATVTVTICVCRQLHKVITGCRPTATGLKDGVLGHSIGACQLSFTEEKAGTDRPISLLRSLLLCVSLRQVHGMYL
jgi:hypothetical protein